MIIFESLLIIKIYQMNKKEAISAIVTLNTLPSQIDYLAPYQRKLYSALEFIKTLTQLEQDKAWDDINQQIEAYHTPTESGHTPAELDDMF